MRFIHYFLILKFASARLYENFKVYSVECETENDVSRINYWKNHHEFDFWTRPSVNRTNKILVSPSVQTEFEKFLKNENFNYEILIENVAKTIKGRSRNQLKTHFHNGNFIARDFSHYWTLPEIEDYINFLAQSTDLNVRRVIIGKSHEGRNIYALTISLDGTVGNQPVLFIDAGIHAREWAGHMSVIYLLHQLVEKFMENFELLRNIDWVIVPVVNPDGYEYTHNHDRFWRKNRRRVSQNCFGVDINRNFGIGWKSSSNPCSLDYSGPFPYSEPETKALAHFMLQFKHQLKLYISMHSYDSFLLYPYSFDYVFIRNWKQHEELCKIFTNAVNKISRFGQYSYGHSATQFAVAPGVSDDYVIDVVEAKMSIVIELPGGGVRGFDFPEENIFDLVKETYVGLREIGIYFAKSFSV